MKTCTRCRRELSVASFSPRPERQGRPRSRCKACSAEMRRAWRVANLERAMQLERAWRIAHPEAAERAARVKLARRVELRPRHAAEVRAHHARNPARHRARVKAWEAKNPAGAKAVRVRNKLRRRGAERGDLTAADIARILARQSGRCAYCGDALPSAWHLDHRVPLSRGGASDMDNLCAACPSCNCRKYTRTAEEFSRIAPRQDTAAAPFHGAPPPRERSSEL